MEGLAGQQVRAVGPPSKKARKEEENVKCIGGMRGPARAVKLIPGLRRVGSALVSF